MYMPTTYATFKVNPKNVTRGIRATTISIVSTLDILFSSNHNIDKNSCDLYLKDFSKIYQLKGLEPKNIGHMKFSKVAI